MLLALQRTIASACQVCGSDGCNKRAASCEQRRLQMVTIPRYLKALEIEKRAARIRSHWSAAERVRRTGLPPDVPARLEAFILGRRKPEWCVVSPDRNVNPSR